MSHRFLIDVRFGLVLAQNQAVAESTRYLWNPSNQPCLSPCFLSTPKLNPISPSHDDSQTLSSPNSTQTPTVSSSVDPFSLSSVDLSMAAADTDSHCAKHPNPDNRAGICSTCLKEKLANLTPPGPDFTSSLVFHSSSPGFSSSSTPKKGNTDAAVVGFVVNFGGGGGGGGGVLRKSRSVSCEAGKAGFGGGDGRKGRKSGGFWKRLIRSTSRKTKGVLMLSSKRVE
ncbi:hypothetical protein AKJ16_DCAP03677 [Drosera capensis]